MCHARGYPRGVLRSAFEEKVRGSSVDLEAAFTISRSTVSSTRSRRVNRTQYLLTFAPGTWFSYDSAM